MAASVLSCTHLLALAMVQLQYAHAGTGPDFILSLLPQALKANKLPSACAAQLCYHLAPFSAITLVDIKPPVTEADATALVM